MAWSSKFFGQLSYSLSHVSDTRYQVNTTATFKFIVSSVPFTSLWQHDALKDSWAAFETEKRALLDVLHTVPNVIILSGDRHEFAAIEFNPDELQVTGSHRITRNVLLLTNTVPLLSIIATHNRLANTPRTVQHI